jgi:transposase
MLPQKKYVVTLNADERSFLEGLIRKGKAAALKLQRARILLKAEARPHGPGWTDERIAEALDVGVATVQRLRKRLVEGGLQAALNRKPQAHRARKIDGDVEAQLVALACSSPPEGRSRWTLQMLADQLVELRLVDSLSAEGVRQRLKKTISSRG